MLYSRPVVYTSGLINHVSYTQTGLMGNHRMIQMELPVPTAVCSQNSMMENGMIVTAPLSYLMFVRLIWVGLK